MKFTARKNPSIYLEDTHDYITDLGRVTILRDKCETPDQKEMYNNIIHVMQEVLLFMNTINSKDRKRSV